MSGEPVDTQDGRSNRHRAAVNGDLLRSLDQVAAAGACRLLTPGDLEQVSNASATVECSQPHTAETFEVGELPASFADAEYDAPELATIAYEQCGKGFMEFLGADESLQRLGRKAIALRDAPARPLTTLPAG